MRSITIFPSYLLFSFCMIFFLNVGVEAKIVTYEFLGYVNDLGNSPYINQDVSVGDQFSGFVMIDTSIGFTSTNTESYFIHDFGGYSSIISLQMISGNMASSTIFSPIDQPANHKFSLTKNYPDNPLIYSTFSAFYVSMSGNKRLSLNLIGEGFLENPIEKFTQWKPFDLNSNHSFRLSYLDLDEQMFGTMFNGTLTSFKRSNFISPITYVDEGISIEGRQALNSIIQDYIDNGRTETRLGIQVGNNIQEGVKILKVGEKFYFEVIPKFFGIELGFAATKPIDGALNELNALGEVLVECGETNGNCEIKLVSNSPSMLVSETILDDSYTGVSFEYLLENLDDDDSLIISINEDVLFSISGSEFANNVVHNTGFIDFSEYVGQGGIFSIGLLTDELGRTVSIRNLSFFSKPLIPVPAVLLLLTNKSY